MRLIQVLSAIALAIVSQWVAAAAYDPGPLGLPALPVSNPTPRYEEKKKLGRALFFDARLSRDGSTRCASCHQPSKAFTDGETVSRGIDGKLGTRNAPSLLNSIFNTSEFWDGRRLTLEDQALDPLINPRELGLSNYDEALRILRNAPEYSPLFLAAFNVATDRITVAEVAESLAAYERSLLAADSPFDRYAYGAQPSAMPISAVRGLALFIGRAECSTCHLIGSHYALFTDNEFHALSLGIQRIGPKLSELTVRLVSARRSGERLDETVLNQQDLAELGRFSVTLDPATIGQFRTPSLRNAAITAPYMHDGSVPTLEAAINVELYRRGADHGRPLILTPSEKSDLAEFIRALTSPAFAPSKTPDR